MVRRTAWDQPDQVLPGDVRAFLTRFTVKRGPDFGDLGENRPQLSLGSFLILPEGVLQTHRPSLPLWGRLKHVSADFVGRGRASPLKDLIALARFVFWIICTSRS